MASSKITALTANSVPVDADLLVTVDDVAVTPVTKKTTIGELDTHLSQTTKTLTNKTLTSPVINSPTGIVKGDVGLGNVDNTSDATKNAATATLTNKTLTTPVINSPTGIVKGDVGLGNVDNTSDATKDAATATLTNKTITAPTIDGANVDVGGGAAVTPLRFLENSANGTNYMGLKAPAAVTTSLDLQLPDGDGTSGQVLSTDGAGVLSWATAGGGSTAQHVFSTIFEAIARWNSQTSGSGSNSFNSNGYVASTGATATSHARIRELAGNFMDDHFFDDGADFSCEMQVTTAPAGEGHIALVAGKVDWGGGSIPHTADHFGFRIAYSGGTATLYATQADGTTESKTDITSGVTVTNANLYRAVIVGSDIKYYVNGTLKTTISTNNPNASGAISVWLGASNNATANSTTAEFSSLNLKLNSE